LLAWAYARPYHHSDERRHAVARWLHHYNRHRLHAGVLGSPLILGLRVTTPLLHTVPASKLGPTSE